LQYNTDRTLTLSVLIAYGDADHPIPQTYLDYANAARELYMFGQYTESPLPSIPGSPSLPAIVLYKSFDEGHAVLPAESVASVSADILESFIKTNSVPLFDEIAPENFGSYASQGIPIAYLFADPEQASANKKLIEELTPIAKEYKGKVNFVWIDAIKFIDHGKSLNLPGTSWPAFVVQDLAQQTKYPMTGAVSTDSVSTFMQKYISGDVPASIKSAPVPASNNGPVYTLVADGWDALYKDADKDVFAEFYAPWCGHCRESL
jgi:protein disulfide-isomerase A1